MRVFVAGGTGAIGIPLVRALVAAGHHVTALTRSSGKREVLSALGATAAVADALDHDALRAVIAAACPTHVVHQLTALPKAGPRGARDLAATNRLRVDGTRNLLHASLHAGVRRLVGGSFALLRGADADAPRERDAAGDAVRAMESQILEASRAGRIEGVVVRYGLFYGPDVPSTRHLIDLVRRRRVPIVRGDRSQLPCIHIDDAVSATVAALALAPAGSTYDIVDDEAVSLAEIVRTIAQYTGAPAPLVIPAWLPRLFSPYMARMTSIRMPLSNATAQVDLAWRPQYPTWRQGLADVVDRIRLANRSIDGPGA